MGILGNIGKGKNADGTPAGPGPSAASSRAGSAGRPSGAMPPMSSRPARPAGTKPSTHPGTKPGTGVAKSSGTSSKLPGKKRKKGAPTSPRERIASAAAPLHDRRRRLVGARETTLRDLGGLMLEMYKRNRFREELLLDKCEEVLAIEVEIAHVDQRLFQLAPPNAAGMRPIGRCECGAPIHPGQNFCGVCGRSFATLTQVRSCSRCGSGLRPGDQYCATCGAEAPDALQAIEAAPPGVPGAPALDATAIASSAVAETLVMDAPPLDDSTPRVASSPPTPASAEAVATESDVMLPPIVLAGAPLDEPATAPQAASAPVGGAPPVADTIPAVTAVPAEPSMPAPMTEPAALAIPEPTTTPAGFDWTTPPPAPEAAMDAAVDAIATSPTDPETPFAGFPLTSTVPPPPIVDPSDLPLVEPAAPTPVEPRGPDVAAPEAVPAAPIPTSGKAAKAAEREAKKARAKEAKQRARDAKLRAKAKAKAARERRKRGGDS